jgi:hypothetical protein
MAGSKDVSSRLGKRQRVGIKAADLYSGAGQAPPEPRATAPAREVASTQDKQKPGRKKLIVVGEAREHFSSSLRPSSKRLIKVYALALGINDYEVLDQALDEYFDRHKGEKEKAGF